MRASAGQRPALMAAATGAGGAALALGAAGLIGIGAGWAGAASRVHAGPRRVKRPVMPRAPVAFVMVSLRLVCADLAEILEVSAQMGFGLELEAESFTNSRQV